MRAFPINFNRLVTEHFPALAFGEAVAPSLRALVTVLADRDGLTLEAWLEHHLGAILAELAPEGYRKANAGDQRFGWFGSTLAQWQSLPADRAIFYDDDVTHAAQALRPVIEAMLKRRPMPPTPMQKLGVPNARRHTLYAESALLQITQTDEDKKVWFTRLKESGTEREIPRVTSVMIQRVERLLATAPNLHEATHFVLDQLAIAQRDGHRLALPPLLLVGPPAAGKTWWAEELAHALGTVSESVQMGAVTSSFELSGGSSAWNAARPGRILRTYLSTTSASPVFVLDEIEKISAGNYDPAPVLLYLIEPLSSARFRDEFFDAEFDVSRAIFIATANDPNRMDPALRSRFREIVVKSPTREQREPIIDSLWQRLRRDRARLHLPERLDAEVMAILVERFREARQMRRILEDGLGRAAHRSGPLVIEPGDVGGPRLRLVPALPRGNSVCDLRPTH
jgi:hypothetical protein